VFSLIIPFLFSLLSDNLRTDSPVRTFMSCCSIAIVLLMYIVVVGSGWHELVVVWLLVFILMLSIWGLSVLIFGLLVARKLRAHSRLFNPSVLSTANGRPEGPVHGGLVSASRLAGGAGPGGAMAPSPPGPGPLSAAATTTPGAGTVAVTVSPVAVGPITPGTGADAGKQNSPFLRASVVSVSTTPTPAPVVRSRALTEVRSHPAVSPCSSWRSAC
jgi:hypothetical protein